jgi:hypothetical protein
VITTEEKSRNKAQAAGARLAVDMCGYVWICVDSQGTWKTPAGPLGSAVYRLGITYLQM